MFERYTEAARRTLFFARYETTELGGVAIETEHLLLGLLRDTSGVTRGVFRRAGLFYDDLRNEIQRRSGRREKVPTSVGSPFSAETIRVLHHAAADADALSDRHIGTEHLLLGLLREGASVAASIMTRHGMTLEEARVALVDLRAKYGSDAADPVAVRQGVLEEIDAMKQRIQQIGRIANASAGLVVARIEKDLDELKRSLD